MNFEIPKDYEYALEQLELVKNGHIPSEKGKQLIGKLSTLKFLMKYTQENERQKNINNRH